MPIPRKTQYLKDTSAIDELANKWPSTLIVNRQLDLFSGGVLRHRTQANLRSKNDPRALPVHRIGKKIAYRVSDVIDWLRREALAGAQAES
jgi:hypothetical protein